MKIVRKLDDHLEEFFLVIFSIIMVTAIAMQVFMRYVMQSSLVWSEELARYCFIWLVYLGVSYAVKKQRHIKVDAILLLLKDRGKIVLNILVNILFLCFAVTIIIYGYDITRGLFSYGQTSAGLNIPMGFVYMATPVGMGLTAVRIIQQLAKQIKTLFGEEHFVVKTEQELILEDQTNSGEK